MDKTELENRFKFHSPKDENTKAAHEDVRHHCLTLATHLNILVLDGREKSLAITHLEEVMMWANTGIARNGNLD